ncbi:helix-turn-helix domain-containing protein [Gordonia polyisoprenivorans]|uniref:helix-turn-helix domain-containing protein n=1 Tax=Gordonia polyisoprenivorans TaxID=84595 RepID=UPI0030CBC611
MSLILKWFSVWENRRVANSPSPALALVDGDREVLLSWTRSTTIRSGLAQRARIVLLAADGIANARIATEVGTTTTSVWKWREHPRVWCTPLCEGRLASCRRSTTRRRGPRLCGWSLSIAGSIRVSGRRSPRPQSG